MTDEAAFARLDEGMRHVLTSLDEIKKSIATATDGHQALDRRVTMAEADLEHLRGDLEKEQERQRENARRFEERLRAVELRVYAGAAVLSAAGFALHWALK